MVRGMHYMCWFKEDWNYHPSMMSKRLQQVEDIVRVGGNMLLWSCLGSGAIGLPYLEKEAYEKIQPRFKFYGYLNDKEFCQECEKRDIIAYAVLWKAQLWEFPVELNEDESEILSLNKLRGVGKKAYLGMSELSTNRYPKLFSPIEKFFPDGLYNAQGERVGDFLEELSAKTLEGQRILSSWLMVPGHDHKCYTPCANNPAYMTYMKKLLDIMIDAGAGGILLDEYDVQIHALGNGGCFCKDCVARFRDYLKENPSPEAQGLDLKNFDYRDYLLGLGYTDGDLKNQQLNARMEIPLFKEFIRFNLLRLEEDFKEIAEYSKAYALKTRGKALPVSANLFNCLPRAQGLRKYCDTICGEKGGIKSRQDGFYKFGYAFMGGKEGSFIEDPNPHILEMLEDIDHDRHDGYRLFMLEPLIHGFNIAISYGGWLMNFKQDSFYPNLAVEQEMGDWLKEKEALFTQNPVAEIALLYDQRSALEVELFSGNYPDPSREGGFRTFFDLAQDLCNQNILFNVLYVSEDEPLTPQRLAGYKTLFLPDAYSLTQQEKAVIHQYAREHRVAALGRMEREMFGYRFDYTKLNELFALLQSGTPLLSAPGEKGVGVALHRSETGYVLHLLNYNLNNQTKEISHVPEYTVTLRQPIKSAVIHNFPGSEATVTVSGNTLTFRALGILTVTEISL